MVVNNSFDVLKKLANEVEHPDNAVTVEDEDELEADEEDESQDGEPPDFHG